MRAGRLRHRPRLWRNTPTTVDGSTTIGWTDLGYVWGAVEPIRGREALIAGATLAEADTRIVLRYNTLTAGLLARDRIEHRGVYYNIYSIADIRQADREIEILAKSGLNNG